MTLIVDYGTKRVKMPYKIAQGSNWLEADHWCTRTLNLANTLDPTAIFTFKSKST